MALLVAPDPSGFKNPIERAAPPVPVRISDEMLRVAVLFHAGDLRAQPAVSWPEYYQRLGTKLEAAGLAVEDAQVKAIRDVFLRASVFRMPPNRGGISIRDEIVSEEDMKAALHAAEQAKGPPGVTDKSQ